MAAVVIDENNIMERLQLLHQALDMQNYAKAVSAHLKLMEIAINFRKQYHAENLANPIKTEIKSEEESRKVLQDHKDNPFRPLKLYYERGLIYNPGDHTAHLCLGYLYQWGLLGVKDERQALIHYVEAAKGNVQAQSRLGFCCYRGMGTKQDCKKAVEYFAYSAKEGYLMSQMMMGLLTYHGQGIEQDQKQGLDKLLSLAATNNYIPAQLQLGHIYKINKDYPKALKWFRIAAKHDGDACLALCEIYAKGLGVVRNLDTAIGWLRSGIQLGDPECSWRLGQYYETILKSFDEALGYFEAASKRSYDGMFHLANFYSNRGYIEKYLLTLEIAADHGSDVARLKWRAELVAYTLGKSLKPHRAAFNPEILEFFGIIKPLSEISEEEANQQHQLLLMMFPQQVPQIIAPGQAAALVPAPAPAPAALASAGTDHEERKGRVGAGPA